MGNPLILQKVKVNPILTRVNTSLSQLVFWGSVHAFNNSRRFWMIGNVEMSLDNQVFCQFLLLVMWKECYYHYWWPWGCLGMISLARVLTSVLAFSLLQVKASTHLENLSTMTNRYFRLLDNMYCRKGPVEKHHVWQMTMKCLLWPK